MTSNNGHESRRSSLQELRRALKERLHSHFMSTLALCSCVLTMFYLLMNVFPYSGFMAMHLVPGLTRETAGPYAGILSSSFMVGRALSSYPWGKLADRYGRVFVLVASLINSSIFSLLFGLSTSFPMAMAMRFLMGLGNGLMLVARTSVTELAKGDHDLEKKGMGMVMSMVGYGMLIAPAFGGLLSEPLKQFPDKTFFGGKLDGFLSKYPFFLPNLVASLICLISLVFVLTSVEETLPDDKRRSVKHLLSDLMECGAGFGRNLLGCCRGQVSSLDGYDKIPDHDKTTMNTITTRKDEESHDDIEEELKILEQADCSELSVLMSSKASRASYSSALHRQSYTESIPDEPQEATAKSILSKKTTRDHLIAYWVNAFFNVAVNEAFPLFAMSKEGGLGWTESKIGGSGTASGLIFCIVQYVIFNAVMKNHTLHKSLRIGAFLSNVTVIFFPISLLLPDTWSFILLSSLMALIMIFNSVFYACMTIATNRTVVASHRATLNGLSSVGASAGRATGPIFAGCLVAFSMSDSFFPAYPFGAVTMYLILTIVGLASYWATLSLSEEGEDEATTEQDKK